LLFIGHPVAIATTKLTPTPWALFGLWNVQPQKLESAAQKGQQYLPIKTQIMRNGMLEPVLRADRSRDCNAMVSGQEPDRLPNT